MMTDPLDGMIVDAIEAEKIDTATYRLSWRSDNTARVSRREIDTTGMVQCCKAATCRVAEICAFGKPHYPTEEDSRPAKCFDHRPYVSGGITVWAEPCERKDRNPDETQ